MGIRDTVTDFASTTPALRCSLCGTQNDPGARFCADCGARLVDPAPAPAAASASAAAWPEPVPAVGAGASRTAGPGAAPAGGIQLPVATRVVHVGPGGAAVAAPAVTVPAVDPGWLRAESLGGTLAKALVAAVVGVVLLVLNRHDPTGSAGIFALWAWYVAALYLLTTLARAVGRAVFKG